LIVLKGHQASSSDKRGAVSSDSVVAVSHNIDKGNEELPAFTPSQEAGVNHDDRMDARGDRGRAAGADGVPAGRATARLRQTQWTVVDEFTPGLGGPRHVDVYIGEETGPDMTGSPWYMMLTGATLRIG
jgi:hypothetical protein